MIGLKLQIFKFIDEVIAYKHDLRFEIDEAKKAVDETMRSIYMENERFINYTSRIKEDDSLQEKIIRQNYQKLYKTPSEIFDNISDIIGCRVECRFMNDEYYIYRELFRHFPIRTADGYYKSDLNPNLELNLSQDQPLMQKNGFPSYRIDGRYLGKRVLNFELQIKSIVNVFWNEIDHKILYKNYNYLITGDFVREMMGSINSDLSIIDKQLEMVYNHLRSLDSPGKLAPNLQIRTLIGQTLQEIYIVPLREKDRLVFDFRSAIDIICNFLFERVEYESRESLASEFVRIMDEAMKANCRDLKFGETIDFDPPILYQNSVEKLGLQIQQEMNSGIVWNLIIRILFDLNPEEDPRAVYQSFVDYLYFRLVKVIRDGFTRFDFVYDDHEDLILDLVSMSLDCFICDLKPDYFTDRSIERIRKHLHIILLECRETEDDMNCVRDKYLDFLKGFSCAEERTEGEDHDYS